MHTTNHIQATQSFTPPPKIYINHTNTILTTAATTTSQIKELCCILILIAVSWCTSQVTAVPQSLQDFLVDNGIPAPPVFVTFCCRHQYLDTMSTPHIVIYTKLYSTAGIHFVVTVPVHRQQLVYGSFSEVQGHRIGFPAM